MVWLHPHPHPQVSVIRVSSSSFLWSRRFLPVPVKVKVKLKRRSTFITLADHPSFICNASWQELAGVLLFSAIPFTAVKAIANSPLGESLQRNMEETKKSAIQNSSNFKALAEEARNQRYNQL